VFIIVYAAFSSPFVYSVFSEDYPISLLLNRIGKERLRMTMIFHLFCTIYIQIPTNT